MVRDTDPSRPDARCFETFISAKIAKITGQWRWARGYKPPDSVHADPAELARFCKIAKGSYARVLRLPWLKERSVMVRYEDIAADAQKIFNEAIFPFLNLPASAVSSAMPKQNTQSHRELIDNYDEIEPLIGAEWAVQEYPRIQNIKT